jgi:hypothetical protein
MADEQRMPQPAIGEAAAQEPGAGASTPVVISDVSDVSAVAGLAGVAGVCRGLRWKGMFIDSPPDPTIPNPRDGFCWCRHTLTCLGPDGQVAEPAACLPGRRCYEGL